MVVRGQTLTKAEFLAYSRRFGRLKPHRVRKTRDPEHAELTVMGLGTRKADGQVNQAIYNRGGNWHTDSPWDTEICKGTQLYGVAIPSTGGDTAFASMYEAYDSLPESLKQRIAGLKAEHVYGGRKREGQELLEPEDRQRPPAVYPIVRVHEETGRTSLYANPHHLVRIQGLSDGDSDALIKELTPYMTSTPAQYRHQWRVGDIVLWDNRCGLHKACGGYPHRRAAHPLAHDHHAGRDPAAARRVAMPSLSEQTTIPLPADEVWPLLSDPALVASCIPGATLSPETPSQDGGDGLWRGSVRVKFGPTVAVFRGEATLAFDHTQRTCTIEGRGIDGRGASRALASGNVRVTGKETTELAIDGNFSVSGPLETFANAGGVHVARALLGEFSTNLAKLVAERRPAEPVATAPAIETPPAPPATELRAGNLMWRAFLSWLRSLFGKRETPR